MSTDVPFTPPKKKPSAFWWIGGAFLVLTLIFLWQLLGPSPRIIVSPQTTYITEPLRADGLPDYEKYLFERCRDGVTPENNAASLLWPAFWPGALDPSEYAAVAAELGLDAVPSKADAVVRVDKEITGWLRAQQPQPENANAPDGGLDQTADQLLNQVVSRPWTSDEFPWLAKWVSKNEKPLSKMVEASHLARCYFPSPTMLNKQNYLLIGILLPGPQDVRECGRSLATRAMWQVGEHRPMEAWQDLLATHRIGRLTAQGPTLIEQLIGIAIDGIACRGTGAMLHESHFSADQARQVMRDLDTLESFSRMADSMANMERLGFLDAVTHLSRGGVDEQALGQPASEDMINLLRHFRIDWNIVLRKGNEMYDRSVAAARLPTFEARQQALGQVERDVQQFTSRTGGNTLAAVVLNPSARNNEVVSVMIPLFLPATNAAMAAQDRANSMLALTRLAAALAVYRAEHGSYPEKLDDLVPNVLAKLSVDLYHAKPFIYRHIDDGYLLYTAGPNGIDDGGSNEQMSVFEGRESDGVDPAMNESLKAKIPPGADDFSIRLPAAPFKLPKPPASEPTTAP